MRLGVHLLRYDFPGWPESIAPTLARVAQAAEQAGVANLSLLDHFQQLPQIAGKDTPMLEGYTTLGFLAGHTSTVELQLLVTGVTYRHPGVLAKIVSTLDVLCGGRAALGIGAAWYQHEHEALGVPFPPMAERFERLEEALQIVMAMWSDDNGPYQGKYYLLTETVNSPQPIRRPRPPIMIGGEGEKKTLRLVAKYGDACNLSTLGLKTPAAFKAKLDVLAAHCEREGTDYHRIRKTLSWNQDVEPKAFLDHMREYAALGFSEVHVVPWTNDPVPFIEQLGEHVIPELNRI